jgi:hypothetical protein
MSAVIVASTRAPFVRWALVNRMMLIVAVLQRGSSNCRHSARSPALPALDTPAVTRPITSTSFRRQTGCGAKRVHRSTGHHADHASGKPGMVTVACNRRFRRFKTRQPAVRILGNFLIDDVIGLCITAAENG